MDHLKSALSVSVGIQILNADFHGMLNVLTCRIDTILIYFSSLDLYNNNNLFSVKAKVLYSERQSLAVETEKNEEILKNQKWLNSLVSFHLVCFTA